MAELPQKRSHYRYDDLVNQTPEQQDDDSNWLVSYADMMTLLVGFFIILLSFSVPDAEKYEALKKSVTEKFGGEYEKPFEALAEDIKKRMAENSQLADQIKVETSDSGVKISFIGTGFFETGSADIQPAFFSILEEAVNVINGQTEEFNLEVEGHTDDTPFTPGGAIKNNWELSSLRACRVLDYFLSAGIDKNRLTAIGYGDTKPEAPNRDQNGIPIIENQQKNRRVVLRLISGRYRRM